MLSISNWCAQGGTTALHYGVQRNLESMIPLLLEHKADVNIQNKVSEGLGLMHGVDSG